MPKARVKPKYLLLDTHVWVWLMNGNPEINKKKHLQVINQYSQKGALRISAISVWELGMLFSKGRLILSKDVSLWVKESLKGQGISLEALSIDVLMESTQMGDDMHGDPADRMIITTAKHIEASIMTADRQIISYCRIHRLPVHPVD